MLMGEVSRDWGGVTVVRQCNMQPSGRCEMYLKGVPIDGEV